MLAGVRVSATVQPRWTGIIRREGDRDVAVAQFELVIQLVPAQSSVPGRASQPTYPMAVGAAQS